MQIKLFSGVSPNISACTHYVYTSVDSYLSRLATDGTAEITFENANYRYLDGVFEIAAVAPQALENRVTYMTVRDAEDNYFRAYTVYSAEFRSGYLRIRVAVDLWGTYIAQADVTDLYITRCNRDLSALITSMGYYDSVDHTDGAANYTEIPLADGDQAYMVFSVAYQVGQSDIFGNNSATAVGIYAIDINALSFMPDGMKQIDYAAALVSGIYSIRDSFGSKPAGALRAWIVPASMLRDSGATPPTFQATVAGKTDTVDVTPVICVAPNVNTRTGDPVDVDLIGYMSAQIPISAGMRTYVGTYTDAMPIENIITRSGRENVVYMVNVGQSDLSVHVMHGADSQDITSAFEITLTTNDGNMTTMQRIQAILGTITGVAGSVAMIAAGGVGVLAGAMGLGKTATEQIRQGTPGVKGGGDGMGNWRAPDGSIRSPFAYIQYSSTESAYINARYNGARWTAYGVTLQDAAGADLLGVAPAGVTFTDTYVVARARVSGVPEDARSYIESALAAGVYYVVV